MAKHKTELFDVVNVFVLLLLIFVTLFPFWYSVVGSFNDGSDYIRGGVYFWPRVFTDKNYQAVFRSKDIGRAFYLTIMKSVIGTITSLFVTALASYGMSRPNLKFKKFYIPYMLVTMYFGGGLIPSFILIKNLGLYNTFWVYIIPGLFGVWNLIVMRTFFSELPSSLLESAKIDGAGEYRIFFQIVLPLSKAVIAAILLFTLVGHWNSYFDSMIYTTSKDLQTLQLFLKKLITDPSSATALGNKIVFDIPEAARKTTPQTIKLAAMIVTAAPILFIYPFLQKYFAKGVMIGSIKG